MEQSLYNIFDHLRENAPLWILRLEEVPQVPVSGHSRTSLRNHSLATSKSRTEIIHLENGELHKAVGSPSLHVSREGRRDSLSEKTNSNLKSNWNRCLASISSHGVVSGQIRSYRARNGIDLSYDATTQKQLENIVDEVTKVKEMIRRARKASLPASQRFASDVPSHSESENEPDDDILLSQLRFTSLRYNTNSGENKEDQLETRAVEKARKNLDRVLDLCNRGAFQLLRDGNCQAEIRQAKEALEDVLDAARYGAASSKAEAIVNKLRVSSEKLHRATLNNEMYRRNRAEQESAPVPIKLVYRLNGYLGK